MAITTRRGDRRSPGRSVVPTFAGLPVAIGRIEKLDAQFEAASSTARPSASVTPARVMPAIGQQPKATGETISVVPSRRGSIMQSVVPFSQTLGGEFFVGVGGGDYPRMLLFLQSP